MSPGERVVVRRPGLKTHASEYEVVEVGPGRVQVKADDGRVFWIPEGWVES